MRLHRLEITAFGPFADRQRVDFDQLSRAGLFLLHGPTGAGKTSVLDAVCFALYGRVPGPRGAAGRLRSDHAVGSLAPEVVCEFSVGGRRLEVTRTAEWQRPKKRGTGTVREQAHVVLRERVDAGWKALTNRIDEAAEELQQLIGLGPEQFTKLILLPQGDFAAFLRAGAEERRPLLQKLFGTDRFAEVERWLADRRRETEHQVQAARITTARLLARAEEARLRPEDPPGSAPDGPPGDRLEPEERGPDPVTAPEAAARVRAWADEAASARSAAHAATRAGEAAFEAARREHDEAAGEVEGARRRDELAAELDRLLGRSAEQHRQRAVVEAAAAAKVLAPLLGELDAATDRVERAQARADRAAAAVPVGGQGPGDDDSEAARLGRLREEIGALAGLLRAQDDLRHLDERQGAGQRQIEAATADLAATGAEAAELADQAEQTATERNAAELVAVTVADRERDAERARAVARGVLERDRLEAELAPAGRRWRAAVDAHQAAVDAAQRLRARRLDGMAAELAAGLAPAGPCPVCGSPAHPAPAAAVDEPVTAAAQRRAEQAQSTAEHARQQAQQVVHGLEQQLAGVLAITAGTDAAQAAQTLGAAEAAVAQARAAAARVRRLVEAEADIAVRQRRCADRAQAATRAAAAAREELAAIAGRRDDLRVRLDEARGDDVDVRSRHQRLTVAAQALAEFLAARGALADALGQRERARLAADRAAAAAGFANREAAAAALLPDDEARRLRRAVTAHDEQVARLRALLADLPAAPTTGLELELDLGADDPAARLGELAAALAQARAAHEAARERHTLATRAARALDGLADEIDRHAAAIAPLIDHFSTLEGVSRCAEGTGGDNALRMRLSSYVLAARLEQVAAAASVRLTAMSGGRYLLVHTDGPSRGGARSGLGLAVVDGWTGVQRDPASLSGGETFCTSLALALGLADVLQAEAGGSVIETLLVDEGFGSLDEETLDEVMDVLDGLRSAGRAVGLVSHVADLRDRIPARLEVVKGRGGSRLVA